MSDIDQERLLRWVDRLHQSVQLCQETTTTTTQTTTTNNIQNDVSSAAQFANLANVVRTTIARDEAETPTWLPKDARAARKLVNPVEDFKFLLRKLSLPAVMADLKEFQAEKQTPALSPIQSAMLLEADSYMLTLDSDAWTEHFEKYLKQNQAADLLVDINHLVDLRLRLLRASTHDQHTLTLLASSEQLRQTQGGDELEKKNLQLAQLQNGDVLAELTAYKTDVEAKRLKVSRAEEQVFEARRALERAVHAREEAQRDANKAGELYDHHSNLYTECLELLKGRAEVEQFNIHSSTRRLELQNQLQQFADMAQHVVLPSLLDKNLPRFLADFLQNLFQQVKTVSTDGLESNVEVARQFQMILNAANELLHLVDRVYALDNETTTAQVLASFRAHVNQQLASQILSDQLPTIYASQAPLYAQATIVMYYDHITHATPDRHVESPARFDSSLQKLQAQAALGHAANSRALIFENCNHIAGPPLIVLHLVHSSDYLAKLWNLASEANTSDMLVPLEFDTEWENTDSDDDDEDDGAEASTTNVQEVSMDIPKRFTFGEQSKTPFCVELSSEDMTVYKSRRAQRPQVVDPPRTIGFKRRRRHYEHSSAQSSIQTPFGRGLLISPARVDGIVKVKFDWGVGFLHEDSVTPLDRPRLQADSELQHLVRLLAAKLGVQRMVADAANVHTATLSLWLNNRASMGTNMTVEDRILRWLSRYTSASIKTLLEDSNQLSELARQLQVPGDNAPLRTSDWIQQSAGGSSEQQDIRQFVQKIVKQLRISQQRLADDLTRLGAHASQGALSSFKNYKMASNAETRITKYIIMWLKSQVEYLTADERTRLAELEVWSTAQFDALASSKRSIYETHTSMESGDVKRAHTIDEASLAEGDQPAVPARLPAVVHATDILRLQTIDSQPADMRILQATVVAELRRRRVSQLQACHESGLVAAGAGVAIISKLINASNPDEIHVNNSAGMRVDLKCALLRWLKFSMTQPGVAEEYVVEQLCSICGRSSATFSSFKGFARHQAWCQMKLNPGYSKRTNIQARHSLGDTNADETVIHREKRKRSLPTAFEAYVADSELDRELMIDTSVHSDEFPQPVKSEEDDDDSKRAKYLSPTDTSQDGSYSPAPPDNVLDSTPKSLSSPSNGSACMEMGNVDVQEQQSIAPPVAIPPHDGEEPAPSEIPRSFRPAASQDGRASREKAVIKSDTFYGHFSYCEVCRGSGDLLSCHSCPCSYHYNCAKSAASTSSPWYCERCSSIGIPTATLVPEGKRWSTLVGEWIAVYSKQHRRWRLANVINTEQNMLRVKWWRTDNKGGKSAWLDPAHGKILHIPPSESEASSRLSFLPPHLIEQDIEIPLSHQRKLVPAEEPEPVIANDAMHDTYISANSVRAAMCAAGVVCRAVDFVQSSPGCNVFACVRPPGHHAGRHGCTQGCTSTGFCLLNNPAIALYYARIRYGIKKIAVVDIDVHFGNGTAEILRGDTDAFFASVHMVWGDDNTNAGGFYPYKLGGTEVTDNYVSVGVGADGADSCSLSGPSGFRVALKDMILPRLRSFDPEIVIISAGFDGYVSDPLGSELGLSREDYVWATRQICAAAEAAGAAAKGRVISVLEGGYDVSLETLGLAECVDAHVKELRQFVRR